MIRKLPAILFLLFVGTNVHAQITKGSLSLGGSFRFVSDNTGTNSSNDQSETRYLNVSPSVGTAIKENLIAGVELSFTKASNSYLNMNDRNEKDYGGGVFVRRYVTLGKNFYFFAQTHGGVIISNEKYKTGSPYLERKGYSINLGLYPGVSYAINNRFHMETGLNNIVYLNYSKGKNTYMAGTPTKFSYLNAGSNLSTPLSFTLGARYIFLK